MRAVIVSMVVSMFPLTAQAIDLKDPFGAGNSAVPTVHEITPQERAEFERGCLYQSSRVDFAFRHRRPELDQFKAELDACQQKVAQQMEYLRTHGNAAEQYQREVQDEREASDAADEARYNAIRADTKQMGIVFGATFCAMKALRAQALTEIGKEKKYAKIGGYENKAKIYALQNQIRHADEVTAQNRGELKSFKGVTPFTCSSSQVETLLACRADSSYAPVCNEQVVIDLISFLPGDELTSDE